MNKKTIDRYADKIYSEGGRKFTAEKEIINPFKPYIYPFQNIGNDYYVRFEAERLDTFYGFFQPALTPAPLIVHTPGYGGEMSMHPELSNRFNVLHINPLGFTTPEGKDAGKFTMGGFSPVLPDTVLTGGKGGYFDWLVCCVIAIKWAFEQESVLHGRVSFFGTSQGGWASLLLGSIFSGRGTRCVAADQPFLTDIKKAAGRGAYGILGADCRKYKDIPADIAAQTLELIDTVNHAHRLSCPVLLTNGGKDNDCPGDTVESLFNKLGGSKSLTRFNHLTHGYNREFIEMARAWFTIYA